MASNLAKVDAYINGPADYEEIPELTAEDFARGTLMFNGMPLERDGTRSDTTDPRQRVVLELDRGVVQAFKEMGPDWQDRINDVLRAWVTHRVA